MGLPGPENQTAVTIGEHCRCSDHHLREAVVNEDLLSSSLEASVNINLREVSELSGVNESMRG